MTSLGRFFTRLYNSMARCEEQERLREEIAEHIALQTDENLRAGCNLLLARTKSCAVLAATASPRFHPTPSPI